MKNSIIFRAISLLLFITFTFQQFSYAVPIYGNLKTGNIAHSLDEGDIEDALDGSAPCPTDLDNNGVTDTDDLIECMQHWGNDSTDLDGDGLADIRDIILLLEKWGPCE